MGKSHKPIPLSSQGRICRLTRQATCPANVQTPFAQSNRSPQITDEILEALAECQQLREVRVGYTCRCTVKGVLALTSLKRLECLQVAPTPN